MTTTAAVLAKIDALHRAAPRIATGQPGDNDALATVIHDADCGCGAAPAAAHRETACSVLAAGYRADHGARADLAELLAAIATAWTGTTQAPISTSEQLRWTPVCVAALRIANRWLRP